jgi:chitinase
MSTLHIKPTTSRPNKTLSMLRRSKQIILGHLGTNSTRSKRTLHNDTLRRYSQEIRHANENILPYRLSLRSHVDGQIQYGFGKPCLDEACCSKKGKCAHKAAQCAPKNCVSNCDAKAMSGIELADRKTLCRQLVLLLLRIVRDRERAQQGPGASSHVRFAVKFLFPYGQG